MERRPRAAITHRFQWTLIAELETQLQDWWCFSRRYEELEESKGWWSPAVESCIEPQCALQQLILTLDLLVPPACFHVLSNISSLRGGSDTTTDHSGTNIGPISKELHNVTHVSFVQTTFLYFNPAYYVGTGHRFHLFHY